MGEVAGHGPADAATLAGLLGDPARLAVLAAVTLGATSQDEVLARTGLAPRRVATALARLRRAGVVSTGELTVVLATFRAAARAARRAQSAAEPVRTGDPAADGVLRAFLVDGRLSAIPAGRAKRRVILDHVVGLFEPGLRYPEREVNAMLRVFHPDTAALRRHLVDEGFLSRDASLYWRSGGAVDVAEWQAENPAGNAPGTGEQRESP